MAIFNKIRMATERCPLDPPKWGAEVTVTDDAVRVVMNPVMDVVIPLASGNHGKKLLGSKWDNNELRYCLRSLEKHFPDLGRVFIVTEHLPAWLTGVVHLYAKDVHTRNKDANLIDKVLLACKSGVSPVFLRCSDDQCLLREFDGHQVWHLGAFGREGGGKWWTRYNNTCEYLKAHGKPTFFYDCHVPVPVARDVFIKVAEAAPYEKPPGMCINTLYFNFLDLPYIGVMDGQKATIHRKADIDTIRRECQNAIFLGYNDDALEGDIEQFMQEQFPNPSRFETDARSVVPLPTGGICKPIEYKAIQAAIEKRRPCNMLVFGCGRDSAFWHRLNEGGRTLFIENVHKWANVARRHGCEVITTTYNTKRGTPAPEEPIPAELAEMVGQQWDIVFIDGPKMNKASRPGRELPIRWTSRLPGHPLVFLHDYRVKWPSVRPWADRYLGDPTRVIEDLGVFQR